MKESKLVREKHFVLLLIKTGAEQAKALLQTASPSQVLALNEIIHNFRQESFPLHKDSGKILKKKSVSKLGQLKVKETDLHLIIRKHHKLLWEVIKKNKSTILSELK